MCCWLTTNNHTYPTRNALQKSTSQKWSFGHCLYNFQSIQSLPVYFPAMGAVATELLPHLGLLNAAIILHKTLLHNIFRAPLQFFDITPTGRILARFSKDIDVVDNTIPQDIIDILYCIMEVKFFLQIRWQINKAQIGIFNFVNFERNGFLDEAI